MKNKIQFVLASFASLIILIGCAGPKITSDGFNVTVNNSSCINVSIPTIFAQQTCQRISQDSFPVLRSTNTGSCSPPKVIAADFVCTKFNAVNNSNSTNNSNSPEFATNISEPSRLELRAMQTRKFKKSPSQVVKAIIELNKDKGSKCEGLSVPKYTCQGVIKDVVGDKTTKKCISSDGVSSGLIKTNDTLGECKNTRGQSTSYEIDSNYPANSETILRVRLSDNSNPQITDPNVYSKLFKEIADGLFIDAIQLTPAEMQ